MAIELESLPQFSSATLPLFQDLHELDDGGVSSIQLIFPLQQFLLLIREVDELIQRLLVDV